MGVGRATHVRIGVGALALTLGWLSLLPLLRTTGRWRGVLSWAAGALVA